MADDNLTAGLYILITFLIILIVGALLYLGGVFSDENSVNVNRPGVVLQLTR